MTTSCATRCSPNRARSSRARGCKPTSNASLRSIAVAAVTTPRSTPRSSSSTRAASISSSRSTKAMSRVSSASASSATRRSGDSTLRGKIRTSEICVVSLFVVRRPLRPRPPQPRPRTAAQVLPHRGLRRLPCRVGRRRARPQPRRLLHHLHHQRGRTLQVRQSRGLDALPGTRCRRPQELPHDGGRRLVRRQRGRKDRHRAVGPRGLAGLRVRRCPPQHPPQQGQPDGRRDLRHPGRAARLCRAHQHLGQHAHSRQGDPPRIPFGRG